MIKAEERRLRRVVELQLNGDSWKGIPISEGNMRLIREFDQDNRARGLSLNSRRHYVGRLRCAAAMLGKPFREVTKREMKGFIAEASEGRAVKTVNNLKICVKRFYQWLYDMEEKEYPEVVKWMKPTPTRNPLKPEQLVTDEEFKRLVATCENQRDRALLMVIRELTLRPHEALGMRVGDVTPTSYGLMVLVDGKTGARRVPAIESAPDLQLWLNMHAARDDGEAPLWYHVKAGRLEPLNYEGLKGIIRRVKRRAGLKKRIFWYLLRHTGLTEDAKNLPESILRKKAGWVPGSRMPAVYVHLAARDVEEAYMKLHGIQEEKRVLTREPKACPRCGVRNPFHARYCTGCGQVLDAVVMAEIDEERKKIDEVMELALRDPEVQKVLTNRIRELMRSGSWTAPS